MYKKSPSGPSAVATLIHLWYAEVVSAWLCAHYFQSLFPIFAPRSFVPLSFSLHIDPEEKELERRCYIPREPGYLRDKYFRIRIRNLVFNFFNL